MWTPALNALILFSCLFQGLEVFAYRIQPVSKQNSDSSDIPLKRNARVWTDENFACILRHCKQHAPGSSPYLNCLSENCRRGMMAVQRDIEYPDYEDNTDKQPLMIPQFMSESDSTAYIPDSRPTLKSAIDFLSACYERHCRGISFKASFSCLFDQCLASEIGVPNQIEKQKRFDRFQAPDSSSRLTQLSDMLDLLYSDHPEGQQIMDDEIVEDEEDDIILDNDSNINHLSAAIVNKRRVNDEVSQCIQSFCGKSTEERLTCLLKHCHRARSIYKRKK